MDQQVLDQKPFFKDYLVIVGSYLFALPLQSGQTESKSFSPTQHMHPMVFTRLISSTKDNQRKLLLMIDFLTRMVTLQVDGSTQDIL